MTEPFPLQQFLDAFEVTTKVKNKLQPFIAKFKEQNMSWIIRSLEEIHRLFYDDKVDLHLKFNSIFGIKFLFDVGEVILINLIEMYFLPRIVQIACYEVNIPNEKRGVSYFVNQGYPKDTPQIQKFGYNFVRLASEFITAAAVVKPRKLFEVQQLEEPSDYALGLKKLQQTGWKAYPSPVYYKQGAANAIRALFERSLSSLDQVVDTFINYYVAIYKGFVMEDKVARLRLDPHKIIEYGDSFVTAALVGLCEESFNNPSLKVRKNALNLLNELVKWGDIQAAHLICCTQLIDDTVNEIANPELGSKVLSRGKSVFKSSSSNEATKQQFYVEFLKSIQFWALCFPRALKIKNRESKIKFIHDQLRNKLQLQFPEDKELKEKKTIFDRAFERNRKRNDIILKELNEIDSELKPLALESKSIPAQKKEKEVKQESKKEQRVSAAQKSQKHIPTPSGPTGPTSDYQRIKRQILEVNGYIDTLCDNQGKINAKIAKIIGFTGKYQSQIENANLKDSQFDDIFLKADILIERISKINPHLEKYTAKTVNFDQLNDLIHNRKVGSPQKSKATKPLPSQTQLEKKSNVSTQQLPKIDSPTLKSSTFKKQQAAKKTSILDGANLKKEEKRMESSINKIEDITPIKRVREEFDDNERFQDSKDMSSLPEMSRKSIEMGEKPEQSSKINSSKNFIEDEYALNIQPASHTILEASKTNAKKLPEQKRQKQEESLKISFKKAIVPQHPIQEPNKSRKLIESNGALSRLQQEIEQNIQANVPKSIKNVAGSYKLKQQQAERQYSHAEKHQKLTPQNLVRGEESRKSSKIKFDESRMSQPEMIEEEDDMIMIPETNPLETSFHDLKAIDDDFKSNELSFKKCFEEDKYLFGVDRFSKKYKLANDTLNLIKRPDSARKHSRNKQSTISIPNILNERNKRFEEEIKYIEEKKNRKISELQNKIKILETTGSVMKDKIVQQQKEIRHIKAFSEADNSRVKKNSIMEDQDAIFKAKLASVHNRSAKDRSLFEQSRKDPRCLDPQGILINGRKYSPYFQQFKLEKQKKNLLKNKQLLLKNETIEFGCMSKREREGLSITFYITPAEDLDGLVTRVISADSNLDIELQPKHIPSIRKGKQQKVIAYINIKQIPYYLPEIQFTYNIAHKIQTQKFLIPCSFHKFIQMVPTDQREILRRFEGKEKILRGEEVPYSKKLLKSISTLSDYLAGGVILKNGDMNHNGEIEFGGKAVWKHEQFWIRVMVRPNQFLYVQTICNSESPVPPYYVSLITNLLMKNIELQQM